MNMHNLKVRNIAIIAHIDHGKTTLTDAIMRQTGMFKKGMSMDTDMIEKERGITIYSKNAATYYNGTKINIIDTPGHADFSSEVERVLKSIDSVILVVDAQEGPMPQTTFVLKKSLELGLKPIVVINKIDKPAADPLQTKEDIFELFMELGASDEQLDFTTIYTIARDGIAIKNLNDEKKDLTPLLDTIISEVKPAPNNIELPLRAQLFNLDYDNFLGRLAVARIYDGVIKSGQTVYMIMPGGESHSGKVTKLFAFKGLFREEVQQANAGDIIMIAGIPDAFIGETICEEPGLEPLPAIKVDEPTITVNFLVNNSPFAGRDGKFLTSRQIRERLEKELLINIGLKVDFSRPDLFKISARGELQIVILLENMRREGYEIQVSQPKVIIKEIDGKKVEPYEEVIINAPAEFQGIIIKKLGLRKFILKNMDQKDNLIQFIFEGPTRGLLGYQRQFIVDTKGQGILTSRVVGFKPYAGEINKRATGSMTSMATGKALAFSLYNLQDRGVIYISPSTEVYEGMVIGNTSKGNEMVVNPIKGKHLTNTRAAGSDEAIKLTPPQAITIESGLELIADDEYLEITPKNIRIRKKYLREVDRNKAKRNKN